MVSVPSNLESLIRKCQGMRRNVGSENEDVKEIILRFPLLKFHCMITDKGDPYER